MLQLLQRKEKKAKWYKETKKFDDGEESTNGEGRKQRSVFKSLNQEKINEKGTAVEIEGGNVTDPQETHVNAKETCSQTQTAKKGGQNFWDSPL